MQSAEKGADKEKGKLPSFVSAGSSSRPRSDDGGSQDATPNTVDAESQLANNDQGTGESGESWPRQWSSH